MQILFTTIIDGLNLGSVYALVALGYSMVYGIAKMLNFAHGDVIMVGIYSIFVCLNMAHLPAPVAMIVCVVICAVLGFLVEKLAYKPLRQSSSLSACRISFRTSRSSSSSRTENFSRASLTSER